MGILQILLLAWGVVTAILVCMWIYRSALENREEDQIFLDSAGDSMAREQRFMALIVASGVLLATIAGVWIWQSIRSF